MGTLSATGQEKYHQGFQPLLPGFKLVSMTTSRRSSGPSARPRSPMMVEPIQGEGGVVMPHAEYLARLRDLCDRAGILLIVDEVQTGMGRTGKMFGYQQAGIKPDIITLAKALGGGLPIGAMVAKAEIASVMTPGTHGSTFGGNPVASRGGARGDRRAGAGRRDGECGGIGGYLIERLREIGKTTGNVARCAARA